MLFIKFCLLVFFVAVAESQGSRYRDPCRNKDCGDYGCCRRVDGYYDGHSYRHRNYECVCDDGYYWDKDDDVCKFGCSGNDCNTYASCYVKARGSIDYPGGNQYQGYRDNYYYCQCNRGYRGNGRQCDPIDPCDDNGCHPHATCHEKRRGVSHSVGRHPITYDYRGTPYYCQCNDGYYGDGRTCFPHCHNNRCHKYATCVAKPYGSLDFPGRYADYRNYYYYCRCNDGYVGNGLVCKERDPCDPNPCDQYATCHTKRRGARRPGDYQGYTANDYYCVCNDGYYGNGRTCNAFCHGHNCHRYATCIPKRYGAIHGILPIYSSYYYRCQCNTGYTGNGRYCEKDCCSDNPCPRYATCYAKKRNSEYEGYGNYRGFYTNCYYCKCDRGYYGNGAQCRRFVG